MGWVSSVFWVSLIGTPISAGLAWWLWLRGNSSASRGWRAGLSIAGLLAASNALGYYSWLSYRLLAGSTPRVWALKEAFGNLCIWLVLLALAGAVVGKGSSRIPIAVCAILGFINWVPVAIL